MRDVLAEGGDWIDVRGVRKHIQGYLKEFLFDPGLVDAKVGTLSGGERSRLLLAREFARPSNLLVLDEPTNDLDLETLDLLQEVIADYDGTVLIVSHDRDFLDRTVTVTLGLDGSGQGRHRRGRLCRLGSQAQAARAAGGEAAEARASKPTHAAPAARRARAKLTYKDQRDYDLLPARIEELDAAIARDEAALHDPDALRPRSRQVRRADRSGRSGSGGKGRGGGALAGTGGAGRGLNPREGGDLGTAGDCPPKASACAGARDQAFSRSAIRASTRFSSMVSGMIPSFRTSWNHLQVELRAQRGLAPACALDPRGVADLVAARLPGLRAVPLDLALAARPGEAGGRDHVVGRLFAAPALVSAARCRPPAARRGTGTTAGSPPRSIARIAAQLVGQLARHRAPSPRHRPR